MSKTKNDDDYGKGAVENPYTKKKEWKITKKINPFGKASDSAGKA